MLSNAANSRGWLIIIYRVPTTPSTSRVTVWKKVKELGGFLLQQSVYILPDLPATRAAVKALKEQIQRLGGECKILEVASLGEAQEKEIVAGFNKNREEEYTEVIKACDELLDEIADESRNEDFHFADLEENEKHIQRVRELLEGVVKRDYFNSDFRERAARMLKDCEEKFAVFSHEVYSREGIVTEEKKSPSAFDPAAKNRQKTVLDRHDLIARLREIVDQLNSDTLPAGDRKAGPLSDRNVLEWGYRESKEENTLEIRISWPNPAPGKKGNAKKG